MNDADAALDVTGAFPAITNGDVSDALIRQIADHSPSVMVVAAGPQFRILYANRAAQRAAHQADQLVGQPAADAFAFVDPITLVAPSKCRSHARVVADSTGCTTVWWDVSYVPLEAAGTETPAVLITAVDVTHHEVARLRAQAAQDTLDALLEYIPAGVSISHGPDIHVDRISARGLALLRRDADELTGRSALQPTGVWQVYRPGIDTPLPPADRPLARATRTGEATRNETLILRLADGALLPVLCNAGPIRDAAGRVTGAVMTWHDVSELHRAQAAMRDSEERLRAVLLQIPAAVFIVDAPHGQVIFKSRLLDEVLGNPDLDLARAKATRHGWAVHKDGSPYDLSEYPSRRALVHGETVRAEPMAYRRGDGRLIDLEMHAGPVRNAAGEIVSAVAVALDVTERNQAAARLRESEERLRVALEAGGLATWEFDAASNTHSVGRSLAAMLGLPAKPVVLDRPVSAAFIHPDDRERVTASFERALAEGGDYVTEFRAVRADGAVRWFTAHGRIIRAADPGQTRAVGVIRDVTDRRLREDRLREAAAAREVLLREADHRIKNSLQMVGSLLALQRSRLSDPDVLAALDGAIARVMAVSEAHRALHQSADLRHVALDGMLRDLSAHVGTLNPALNFLCDCPADLQLDTERAIPLGLVVSELLTNAAKYAYPPHAYPSGAGDVRTTVSLADGRFEIEVSDAGVGLPPSGPARPRLGSTIVRALVSQIGAEMDVTSAPGQGTRTRLRFPQRV